MPVTTFVSASGGQGTTTLAAVFALHLASQARAKDATVLLVAHDPDDMAATLGLPTARPYLADVVPGLQFIPDTTVDHDAWAVVYDAGTVGPHVTRHDLPVGTIYQVLRGPSYTGLRRIVAGALLADAIVTVTEPGRALTTADVRDVTGLPVIDGWKQEPATARAVDAGLLMGRLPGVPARLAPPAVDTDRDSPAQVRARRVLDGWSHPPGGAVPPDIDPSLP
jgi:hypothetical protein